MTHANATLLVTTPTLDYVVSQSLSNYDIVNEAVRFVCGLLVTTRSALETFPFQLESLTLNLCRCLSVNDILTFSS